MRACIWGFILTSSDEVIMICSSDLVWVLTTVCTICRNINCSTAQVYGAIYHLQMFHQSQFVLHNESVVGYTP